MVASVKTSASASAFAWWLQPDAVRLRYASVLGEWGGLGVFSGGGRLPFEAVPNPGAPQSGRLGR
jgi:hypothetical protein